MTSQQVWFAVNKNENIVMFLDEPKRNDKKCIWEGEMPYINSVLYNEIAQLVQQAQMTYETDAQCIEIQFEKK